MAKFLKKGRSALSRAPGSLVHIGDIHEPSTTLYAFTFDEDTVSEGVPDLSPPFPQQEGTKIVWLNIDGVHDAKTIEHIGALANLHPLVLEDIMHTDQRPKLEEYPSLLFLSMRMLRFNVGTREIDDEQVSLILGRSWVLSFQERPGDVLDPVRERLRTAGGRIRRAGSDYLAYALMDAIIDNYFVVLEHISDWVEDVYERVTEEASKSDLDEIRVLKRNLLYLRKSVWPLREVINRLQHAESDLIAAETLPYLRDAYDHAVQIIDTIETFRDMLSSMMDVYLSNISNRMNEVMKVLTIIATIFIPLSFITGIYGMNFVFMPELQWRYGYFYALGLMVVVAGGMLTYFWRKRWL